MSAYQKSRSCEEESRAEEKSHFGEKENRTEEKSHFGEKESRAERENPPGEKENRGEWKKHFDGESSGSRRKLYGRSAVAAAGMAVFLLWAMFLHPTRIVWPAEMIAYSGYTAAEHVEEYEALPEGRLLFTKVQAAEDGSMVIAVNRMQRLFYRKRYRRMLEAALADAGKLGVDVQVSGDCRSITYFAGDYRTFYEAGLALLRVEAMTSCLQAERNRPDTPWELTIRIYRDHTDDEPLTAFSLPEETMQIDAKMWDVTSD